MNSFIELKECYENMSVEKYDTFDLSNPIRYIPTSCSFHIKKTEEEMILKDLFKWRFTLKNNYTEVDIRGLATTEEEYRFLKMSTAVNQSMFLPIVVSEHFISVYEFLGSPNFTILDINTQEIANRFHTPVLGYQRRISGEVIPENMEYFMQLGIGDGTTENYSWYICKGYDKASMDISVFCECFDLSRRKEEVEKVFQIEPCDIFDEIANLLGVSTWFPKDLTNYKLEKSRKNIRLYRRIK